MSVREDALKLHKENAGKIEVVSKVPVRDRQDLSLAYTPGVAEPCKEINADYDKIYDYTNKGNMVAVVTNGTAVLGLGDIGAGAGMPVMEGKAVLFKAFAGVDAFPICIDSKDVDEIVNVVKCIEPTFGGINLEDISAPACFEVEDKLKKISGIPIFHDDQHGTAIVTCAAMISALKLVGKKAEDVKVVVNGRRGRDRCDQALDDHGREGRHPVRLQGCGLRSRPHGMNPYKEEIAAVTNRRKVQGSLAEALRGADVFIGLSVAGCVTREMVASMAKDAVVFAMANPVPEIMPDEAKAAGARVVATGRSDFPNQINNVLAFPGVFRGALDARATAINEEMKLAAVSPSATSSPMRSSARSHHSGPFDARVARQWPPRWLGAMETGVARVKVDPEQVAALHGGAGGRCEGGLEVG